ncbi:hypothetical protein ACP275_14G059100 [Erythranthe tilingii]
MPGGYAECERERERERNRATMPTTPHHRRKTQTTTTTTTTTSAMPKKSRHKFILLLLLLAALLHRISADDASVMAALAKSITPPPPTWTGAAFCKWQGVSCDPAGKVTSINLSSKSLSGTIPPEINQLSALRSLSLQRNHFSGPLPPLSNMPTLEQVYLDENAFDSIPANFLSGLTSLQSFSINNNTNLPPWNIPTTLQDSTSLTSFLASKANIIGQIPDIFNSLPNFQILRLSYNNMTGTLPISFARSGIQTLWLNSQGTGFYGGIYLLGTMTALQSVWLQSNKFTGPIPDLSGCTELSDLQLRDNSLTGVIPDSLTKLPKLQTVALQNNKFQGPMPSFSTGVQVNLGNQNNFCLSTPGPCDPQVTALLEAAGAMNYPMALAEAWDGNNACQQWTFITCDKGSVTIVNFAKQNWTGVISPAYANLTNLKSLLLNDNSLVGTIPRSLTSLTQLQILDLSNNNISGKVPEFSSTVTVKLTGNLLIGKDIPLSPPPGMGTSSSRNGGSDGGGASSSTSPWVIIVPVVLLVIVFSVLGFFAYKRYLKRQNEKYRSFSSKKTTGFNIDPFKDEQKSPGASSDEKGSNDYHIYDGGNVIIPIEVLQVATDSFSEDNILGRGGFGIVYKGQLHDGTEIAVKRMESSLISDKGLHEFKAEIEVLTKVRHRSLVALHGFCENGNERLLVYEYMPKGCLGQHLFHWKEMGIPPLNWNQRVTVALDVARGVEYLHSLAQQSFIHRDLKPSNILLGDDLRAKVSDFGLVRSAPDGNYSVETRLAGTFGYLAPEYAATGRVTTKVDVYAFGVVLMEIITGRKALDDSLPDEKSHLVTWFRRLLYDKEAVIADLDPVLRSAMDEDSFKSIWKVAELSGHCTARESYQRPDMSHAVNVLSTLAEQWKPAPDDEDSFGQDLDMSLPQALQRWKANEDTSSTMSFNTNHSSSNMKPPL